MKLYAWQPNGHGQLSFFVMAKNKEQAKAFVATDLARRRALPFHDPDHVNDYEIAGWERGYLTVAGEGVVITNENC